MSELIPSIAISEFKLLKAHQIKVLKSVEVISDGEYLFTAIIPKGDVETKDFGKTQAEYLAVKTNYLGGEDPEELKEKRDALISV